MNYNNLSERTNFIAGSSKFKHIPFFLVQIGLPEISLNHPKVTGGRHSYNLTLPGDTIKYGSLSFEMLIDENLLIYEELYKLLENNTNPETNTFGDFTFDFFIEMRNNQGHEVLVFNFDNCRISSLGSLQLETSDDSNSYRMNVEISFDRFYPVRKKRYELVGEYDVIRKRGISPIHKDFTKLELSDFLLWGLPLPKEVNNSDMETGIDMSNLNNESGIIWQEPIKERTDIKVEVISPGNIYLGFTEGSGIESSINGRTGKSLFEYKPDQSVIIMTEGNYVLINDLDGNKLKDFYIETSHSEYFFFIQGKTGTLVNCYFR